MLIDWLFYRIRVSGIILQFLVTFLKADHRCKASVRFTRGIFKPSTDFTSFSPVGTSRFYSFCFVQWRLYLSWFICDYTRTFLLFHIATSLNLLQNLTSLLFLHNHLLNRYRTRTIVQIYNSHICFSTINRTGWFRGNALDLCLGGASFEFWLSLDILPGVVSPV